MSVKTTPAEPSAAPSDQPTSRTCTRCGGAGEVEHFQYGVGIYDVRCPGPNDEYNCDGGRIWTVAS